MVSVVSWCWNFSRCLLTDRSASCLFYRCELFCLAVDLTTNYINKHSFFFFSFVEEKLDESETADKNELGEITKTSQQKTESVVHIKVR